MLSKYKHYFLQTFFHQSSDDHSQLAQSSFTPKLFIYSLKNLSIKRKLSIGFGTLVILTFSIVGFNYFGSTQARISIKRTESLRVPTVVSSGNAQANLLRMLSSLHGYLATGKSEFRDQYQLSRQNFEKDLIQLIALAEQPSSVENQKQLNELHTIYQDWSGLPEQLFILKDNVLVNQPALRLYEQEGKLLISGILQELDQMQEEQQQQYTSTTNTNLILSMAEFESSFTLMVAALQSYITTTNSTFRYEYSAQQRNNQTAWEVLELNQDLFTENQQKNFQSIADSREQLNFLKQKIFEAVENERYREDLYLFKTEVEPLASEMLDLLDNIVTEQQRLLTTELSAGHQSLILGQWKALGVGIITLILAIVMASFLRRTIAFPIQRLTNVTTRIMEGNFEVKAKVESQDEVGTLASTFNQMTAYLKQSHEELEHYNTTLEQRVEQRTQEIKDKNLELEDTLHQLKKTQAQLIQTEKMSSLGQLVAGVAHEINNPVNFIHANIYHLHQYTLDLLDLLQLYQQELTHPSSAIETKIEEIELEFLREDLPQILHSMQTGTQRISKIIISLRNFSRLDESEMKWVDLHAGIDNTLMMLQRKLKSAAKRPEIKVIKDYDDLPQIECYAGQLNQVFLSLISNAIEALNESDVPEPILTIHTQYLTQNSRIQIQIQDNGKGIDPTIKNKVFDPFFTTKPVGQGIGLGLSISYSIIQKHQGDLQCFSEWGKGTTFQVEIPIFQTSKLS
ncbi:two-component sensor histidine kinase [Lyngbya sp. PCC 8106]|nr:two-component sensor histidine kinase [Lyngbya sp. PCC 8106]